MNDINKETEEEEQVDEDDVTKKVDEDSEAVTKQVDDMENELKKDLGLD